jgi:hypothetical protein
VFKIGWKEGEATIVARRTHEGQYRRGINSYAPTGLYHHVYDYVADVTPDDGGPTFRATFVEMFESDDERRPMVGEDARVRFNPKNQQTAFDRDVLWKEAKAAKASADGDFDTIADAPPGTPGANPASPAKSPARSRTNCAKKASRTDRPRWVTSARRGIRPG